MGDDTLFNNAQFSDFFFKIKSVVLLHISSALQSLNQNPKPRAKAQVSQEKSTPSLVVHSWESINHVNSDSIHCSSQMLCHLITKVFVKE